MRAMRERKFENVSDVLARVVRGLAIERELRSRAVEPAWPRAAGPRLAPHSRPAMLRSGILTVEARSAAWLHELFLMRESLRLALNREMGGDYVRELRMRLGTGFAPPGPAQSMVPLLELSRLEEAVDELATAGAGEGALLAGRALALSRLPRSGRPRKS
jgi:hypothetical protein